MGNTIKIGRTLQKEIRAAINERLGYRARQEVGQRVNIKTEALSYNCALWEGVTDRNDTDLWDHCDLRGMARQDIEENHAGIVELDIYCYLPKGHEAEYDLDQNMSAIIVGGKLKEVLSDRQVWARHKEAQELLEGIS